MQNHYGVVVASTLLEECDEGAAVLSFTKYSLPVAAPVEAGQIRDEIANLQVAQYIRFVRLFGHVFYESLETSRLLFHESWRFLFYAIHIVALLFFVLQFLLLGPQPIVMLFNLGMGKLIHFYFSQKIAELFVDYRVVIWYKSTRKIRVCLFFLLPEPLFQHFQELVQNQFLILVGETSLPIAVLSIGLLPMTELEKHISDWCFIPF